MDTIKQRAVIHGNILRKPKLKNKAKKKQTLK